MMIIGNSDKITYTETRMVIVKGSNEIGFVEVFYNSEDDSMKVQGSIGTVYKTALINSWETRTIRFAGKREFGESVRIDDIKSHNQKFHDELWFEYTPSQEGQTINWRELI